MKRLIGYTIAFISLVTVLFILYNLFSYPIGIARALMYLFLLIPLALITLDLGYGEALSHRLDRSLTRSRTIMIQVVIIAVVFVSVMLWGISYANSLSKIPEAANIGEMYPEDIQSIWIAAIPIALYVIYYYAIHLHRYIISKHKQNIKHL